MLCYMYVYILLLDLQYLLSVIGGRWALFYFVVCSCACFVCVW